jgi:peptidoglycan LD-endopeptidase LytH
MSSQAMPGLKSIRNAIESISASGGTGSDCLESRQYNFRMAHPTRIILFTIASIGIILAAGYGFYHYVILSAAWNSNVMSFIYHPAEHEDWIQPEKVRCNQAPFLFPTRGYIGYLWDFSFRPFHRHQGMDIFGGTDPGDTPIYAVADGFLTRETGWKSSLILRIPKDPFQPGRQIWVYYTHMAQPDGSSTVLDDFPPGTMEKFISAGSLLGYQGNFSGTPGNPTGVHLHLSIVKDDGRGHYQNELLIRNTLDPSRYFGLTLNAGRFPELPVRCQ